MKQVIRIGAILLSCACFCGVLSACANDGEHPAETLHETETTAVSDMESETEDVVEKALNRIGTADWNDEEFNIFYVEDLGGYNEEVVGHADSKDAVASAVVNDAVYQRNTKLEELCHLKFRPIGKPGGVCDAAIRREAQSPTGDVTAMNHAAGIASGWALSRVLYNYLDFEHIDYSAPWWDQGTFDFNLGGNVFFMCGAHDIVDDSVTYMVAFNKEFMNNYHLDNPYTAVQNGTWTLPYFMEQIQNISTDNGDGVWDETDIYGFSTSHIIGPTLMYGSKLQFVECHADTGVPTLALNGSQMEKAIDLLDKARRLVHNDHTTFTGTAMTFPLACEIFSDNRAAFFCESAGSVREMNEKLKADYGILPIPKYDEKQDTYYTWTHNVASTLCIPTSVRNPQEFEKILEIYAALSYRYVTPAYRDTLLKTRSVRDPESGPIMDMLFQNRIFDMPQYYTQLGMDSVFKDSVLNDRTDFMSRYTAVSKKFDKTVKGMLRQIERKK